LTADAIVVGAGIVGAACADELARGGMKVTVLEPFVVGGGATAAGMGHVVVMDDSEAQFALTRFSQEIWQALAPQLPRDAEYTPNGTLWVAADEEEMAEVRRKHQFYAARGVVTEPLDAVSLCQAEPKLRPGLAGGLRVPGDSVVYPPAVVRFLLARAKARLVSETAVQVADGRVDLASGSSLTAGVIINATGTAAPSLTPGIEIIPRKGHLLITDRYPGFVRHQLVELGYLKSAHGHSQESVAFNVQPRATGQLIIGSSRQYGVQDPRVEPALLGRMLRRAIEYLPGLADLQTVRTWTGFRPSTPDNLPHIGRAPGFQQVYVAAGHEGLGITTALGTARLIGDCILNRPSPIPRDPYDPSRVVPHAH
jgi:glycine/D-amino acid oxidase-like deaminating enzyme